MSTTILSICIIYTALSSLLTQDLRALRIFIKLMHKIYVLILIAGFWILWVDCQGGRGGGGGGGGGGLYGGRRSSCTTEKCREIENRILFVMLGGCGVFLLAYLLCKCSKGNPSVNNETFVRSNPDQDPECGKNQVSMLDLTKSDHLNIFRNGTWSTRYYQYGKWHGPFELVLSFDPQSRLLKGWGWDNIGKFFISGQYSHETLRMGITKTYIKNTGDRKENLGHSVTIQLTGNARTGLFKGKWYVQTSKYQGEDQFDLRLVRECAYTENV